MKRCLMILLAAGVMPGVQGGDRVYTADQTSNTVSVIDPATNKLLGSIHLGEDVPTALLPLYRGELLVHGLGFSSDHKTLSVVSIGSNSVTLIDTETNTVKGKIYLGRSPHEAFFRPDGKELWAAVRGENYVSVIDPIRRKEIRRIETANGPGMVLFRPDGRYAFVPSSFTPELDVIEVSTYRVVARIPQVSPFSPNLAVDQDEVWLTLKDSGKTQVVSAKPPFATTAVLETGPITNHVTFLSNPNGRFAYVSVGGKDQVLVYRRVQGSTPQLVSTIKTGDLPHGIWGSGDGSRVYVGLENGDAVQAIDTGSNEIIATIPVGQLPQALVYVPQATSSDRGTANLKPLEHAAEALHLTLAAPEGSGSTAHASVSINSLGLIDSLQIAATGLTPGSRYRLVLVGGTEPQDLATFTAGIGGVAITQTLGPLKRVVAGSHATAPLQLEVRSAEPGASQVVLQQARPIVDQQ
ncbi:YncE family protein [Paludibaculum fermentans]|uniref:YncE family protein n=1 Tax=Paludibaculum fermentans TaxID=1473598 RepID=A0A7S7NLN0_PALFE|nr:YncE family protein [Paludibaculum fermentans]QOY85901.1 YncE family protein [Paludibaculum fermentans]